MKAFINKYLPKYIFVPILILIVSNLVVYYGAKEINAALGRPYIDMTGALDSVTPVIPVFSLFYVAAFPFWYISYYLLCRSSKELCHRIVLTDVLAKVFCGLLFVLIPTTNVRPEITGNGLSETVLSFIYMMDSPYNLFPSVHCLESWLCFAYIKDSKKCPVWLKISLFLLMVGICLSTVFTRQHVWVDVIAGVLIAEGFRVAVPALAGRRAHDKAKVLSGTSVSKPEGMKVLITTDYYKPAVNGVVTSVLNLKEELEKQGHEVRILTLSPDMHSHVQNEVYYIASMNVDWVYPNTRFSILPSHSIEKDLIDWHPDIVHSQCEFSTYGYARKIAAECNAPLIHTYHTVYEDYTHYFCPFRSVGKALVALFSRSVLNKTDCVIAPSAKVSTLLREYKVAAPTRVVPTGIDIERFEAVPTREWIDSKRKQFGLDDDKLILLFIGRLAKEKNIGELLDILKANPELPVKLLIVGDGPIREELTKECQAPELKERVVFTGMVSPSEVNYYYHLGDCFVNASTSETQGLTYIEAMAAGLPLLCRKDSCLDGIVFDGKTGWQYNDVSQFLNDVRIMCTDRKLLERMSRNAQITSRRFSKKAFANRVESIYKQCIAG